MMTPEQILNCVMCFVAGGCMMLLVMVGSHRPSRKVAAAWMLYVVIALAVAYKIGKVVLL